MSEHSIQTRNVSRETLEYLSALLDGYESKLNDYGEKLLWWNQKVNLLSRSSTKKEIDKHIVHSLFISVSALYPKQKILADIGTGGGLPGIPLAICYPDKQFILIDRAGKKTTAVHDMAKSLQLDNVTIAHKELEMFHVEHPVAWISKHAIKIKDFIDSTKKQEWNVAFFLKGEDFTEEMEEVDKPLNIISYEIDSVMKDAFYAGKRVVQIKKAVQ